MNELYTNKKYLPDLLSGVFLLLVVSVISFVFGHWRGGDLVRKEALEKGYAAYDDGFAWKSRRAIERPGE
tara:strand:+ start:12377 stop:12586 length:210 start_codon:yes stop_codon:yes gene_type:complete